MKKFDHRNIILMMIFYLALPRALKAKKCKFKDIGFGQIQIFLLSYLNTDCNHNLNCW